MSVRILILIKKKKSLNRAHVIKIALNWYWWWMYHQRKENRGRENLGNHIACNNGLNHSKRMRIFRKIKQR